MAEKGSKRAQQKTRAGNPSDSVAQSKFCSCFGYLNFTQCFNDCFMGCNWVSLCCNCSRCLAGTCQCCKEIGIINCLSAIGCSKQCIDTTCKKDSALCIMFFNGFILIAAGLVAMYLAWSEMTEFGAKYDEADAAGDNYTCWQVGAKTSPDLLGGDPAEMFKLILQMNFWVHVLLVVGCVLTAFSGPVVVLRWAAIPYQAIVGLVPHFVGVFLVSQAADSDTAEMCLAKDVGEDNVMAQHALFLRTKSESQWYIAVIYTVLVFLGCSQSTTRDNVVLKKQYENRQLFHQDTAERNNAAIDEKKKNYFSRTALEVEKLGFGKDKDDGEQSP